jgi:predicted metal-dependent hydrolase
MAGNREAAATGRGRSPGKGPAPPKELREGMTGTYLGQKLTLKISQGPGRRVKVARRGGTLCLEAGPGHADADLRAALTGWYRQEARRVLTEKVRSFSALTGLKYKKVFIKDQKTRWGSCSRQGNLNFNFRLVLAPPEILDYLVIHEMCHLTHPNHSRDFWSLVGAYYPRFREARRWLKEQGPALQGELFRPPSFS